MDDGASRALRRDTSASAMARPLSAVAGTLLNRLEFLQLRIVSWMTIAEAHHRGFSKSRKEKVSAVGA
jgi:hypothetical protein